MRIFDINIDQIDSDRAIAKISGWLCDASSAQKIIVTVNPEFIVEAQVNPAFKSVLNSAALATCDGVGLVWAAKILGGEKLPRLTGVELSERIIGGDCPGAKVFLLGGGKDVAKNVRDKYEPSAIVGYDDGGRLIASGDSWTLENNSAVLEKIAESGANALLVAFGQVKQELWIRDNLPILPNIKAAIGVGGTFDYLSGTVRRAPGFLRRSGLEWLFRLAREPKRWRRVFNATAVFGYLVLKEKIK